jgi:hypothetical protein
MDEEYRLKHAVTNTVHKNSLQYTKKVQYNLTACILVAIFK